MKRRLKYLFCLIVLFSLSTSSLLYGQELSSGVWYLHEGQYQTAKSLFIKAIRKDPDNAKAYYYLGDVYATLMLIDSAEDSFTAGMERNPLEPLNYAGLGRISYYKGINTQALEYFEKGRKLSKNGLTYLMEVIKIALSEEIRDIPVAQKYLDMIESDNEQNPDYYILRGDMKSLTLSFGEAANEYQRAIYYNNNCVQAYVRLGKIYTKSKNYPDASWAFDNAIRLDSNLIAVYKYYGTLNYNFGRYKEAKRYFEIYLSRAEYRTDDQEQYAYILFFSGEYAKASSIVDTLLLMNPDSPVLHRLKAYMSYELGNYQKGLESIETFFDIEPPDKIIVSDYIYKGRLLIRNGQDSSGVRDLIAAYQMDRTKTELITEIAQKFTKLNNHPEAIEWYQIDMKEGNETERNTYYTIGKEYYIWARDTVLVADSAYRAVLLNKADSSFSKVIELSPDAFTGYLLRGRVRSQLDPDQLQGLAAPDYEKALVLIREGDTVKNHKCLQECYQYLSYYYYTIGEKALSEDLEAAKESFKKSLIYLQYLLQEDTNDEQVIATIEYLEAVLRKY